MAISPPALTGWASLVGSLSTTLDIKTRDGIAVSEADGCNYCFGGEVEVSSTPTICRLSDSHRHQLWAIAPKGKTSTSVANAVDGRAISAGPPRLGSIASRPAGLRSAGGGQG